jgi:hypothetical protein
MEDRFEKKITLLLTDGSRLLADFVAEEELEGSKTRYKVSATVRGNLVVGVSERGYFRALQNVRRELEKDDVLLHCFGASEDVYPSGMQESMGPALKAYRTELGKQALSKDIVDIFDSDSSVKASTVSEQELFHQNWLRSLQP